MAAVTLPTIDLLMNETVAQDWVDCVGGDKRRCWFCGRGFNLEDLRKLQYITTMMRRSFRRRLSAPVNDTGGKTMGITLTF